MNYIILNDVNSNTIQGLLIQNLPPIIKPKIRTNIEEIDGRDGDVITKLGYSAYEKEFDIGLYGNYDVDQVISYFNSEGTVIFSNEDDKFYKYTIIEQIDFERLIRFKTAKVKMHVQPFKYSNTDTDIEIYATETDAEGTNLTINNTENGASFLDIQLKGQTSQYTTNGYQLFDINRTPSANVQYVINNGFKLTKGTNRTIQITLPNPIPAGTYYISADVINSTLSSNNKINVSFKNANNADVVGNVTFLTNGVVTTTAEVKDLYFFIVNTETDTATITLDNIMLNSGNTKKNFEPYTDGASPNPSYPQNVNVVTGNTSVKISNKNLWQNANNPIITTYGITLTTNDDNSVTFTGSATNSSIYFTNVKKIMASDIKDGNYTLSFGNGSNTSFLAYRLRKYNGTTKTEIKAPTTLPIANYTYTLNLKNLIDDDTIQVELDLVRYGTGSNDQTLYPQIEFGNTATSYIMHQEQNYEIDLPVENFWGGFDTDVPRTIESVTYTNYKDGSIKAVGTATANSYSLNSSMAISNNHYITLAPGTYTLSGATKDCHLQIYALDNTRIAYTHNTKFEDTFTLSNSTNCFVRVEVISTKSVNEIIYPQLERGTISHGYTPYGKTPIELCQIGEHQDYIYKNNGNWFIHKEIGKIVLDDSYNWTRETSSSWVCPRFICTTLPDLGTTVNGTVFNNSLCNMATVGSTSDYTHYENVFLLRRVNNTNRIDCMFDLASVDALISILANEPMLVYYGLITPTDTQITDENLIAQLEALRNASTYINQTNIITSGDLAPIIYVNVDTIDTNEIEVVNSGNIYSKPVVTITGIGTINLYLNDYQVFILELGDTETTITLDVENMEAYNINTGQLMNRQVTGNYNNFIFNSGTNIITWSGTIASVQIVNYSRWI